MKKIRCRRISHHLHRCHRIPCEFISYDHNGDDDDDDDVDDHNAVGGSNHLHICHCIPGVFFTKS